MPRRDAGRFDIAPTRLEYSLGTSNRVTLALGRVFKRGVYYYAENSCWCKPILCPLTLSLPSLALALQNEVNRQSHDARIR